VRARKVVTVKPTDAYGPRIATQLRAGEVVDVAGFLLRYKAEDVAVPMFDLTRCE